MASPPMTFILEKGMFFPKIIRPLMDGRMANREEMGTTPSNEPDTMENGVSSLYSMKLSVFKEYEL